MKKFKAPRLIQYLESNYPFYKKGMSLVDATHGEKFGVLYELDNFSKQIATSNTRFPLKENLRDAVDSEQRLLNYREKSIKLLKKFRYENIIIGEIAEATPTHGSNLGDSRELKGYVGHFALGRQMKWSWVAIGGDSESNNYYDIYWNVIRIKDYLKRYKKSRGFLDSVSPDPYCNCSLANYKKYEFAAVSNNKMVFFNVKRKWPEWLHHK